MDLFSTRPRVADLAFHLFGRPLHPELFDTLAMRQVEHEDYRVVVRITRTGHVISFQNDGLFLTEIAAAMDDLPAKRLLSFPLRREHTGLWDCGQGIVYQTSLSVEKLAPDIFLHVHEEILAEGNKSGLLHNFQPNHRLTIAPLGLATVEAKPGCLFFSAFHTFPDEHTVLKSQSLIEKKR